MIVRCKMYIKLKEEMKKPGIFQNLCFAVAFTDVFNI